MSNAKQVCSNCGRKMKQQFIGLKHCKCGMSRSRKEGYFMRTPDMVFALNRVPKRKHGTKQVPVIRRKEEPDDQEGTFSVAISEKQQEKYHFHIGDEIKGTAWTKKYPKWEYADYYRAGGLKKPKESSMDFSESESPWKSEVPELSVYRWRGCRILRKQLR